MKNFSTKMLLGFFLFTILTTAANALTPYSHAYTYYNAAGSIVGEEILTCQSGSYYSGTLNTGYYVFAQASCVVPNPPCNQKGPDGSACPPSSAPVNSIFPGTGVVQYVLPGAETITQACATAGTQCLYKGEQPYQRNFGFTWYSGTGGNNGS